MKKVAIVTIYDNNNYGNRLQNYATQEVMRKLNFDATTLKNSYLLNKDCTNAKHIVQVIKFCVRYIQGYVKNFTRRVRFNEFNKNIKLSKKYVTKYNIAKLNEKFDYFVCGSDQVWNPEFRRMTEFDLLEFADNKKKVSFSASFGSSVLDDEYLNKAEKELKKFKAISVREEAGKTIAKELTKREDIEVLVDPTMLLKKDEWKKLEKKPEKLEKGKKYILNYFLGEISKEKKDIIENFAKEKEYEIINILDTKSPFYKTGPSEFLYLIHNAEIVFTDSFHACVFSILYNKPFYVIERVEKGMKNMNSRIDTLLNKMGLQNRKFEAVIENDCEGIYEEVNKKLNIEREKALNFIKNALN